MELEHHTIAARERFGPGYRPGSASVRAIALEFTPDVRFVRMHVRFRSKPAY